MYFKSFCCTGSCSTRWWGRGFHFLSSLTLKIKGQSLRSLFTLGAASQKPKFVCQTEVFVSNPCRRVTKKRLWKGLKAELKCRQQQGLREEQFSDLVAAWGFECSLIYFTKQQKREGERNPQFNVLKMKKKISLPAPRQTLSSLRTPSTKQ